MLAVIDLPDLIGWLFTTGLPYTVAWVIIGCLVLGYSESDTIRAGKRVEEINVLWGLFLWPVLLPYYAVVRIAKLTVRVEDWWAAKPQEPAGDNDGKTV